MGEAYPIIMILTGVIFFAWLYVLVRQTQRGLGGEEVEPSRPIVPVNLLESDEAVIVAEGRGRVVYANDLARQWFGMDGGTPHLSLMAQMIQPSDTLHDLLADAGHASFRLGQRRIEAVSHPIPGPEGRRMVVVMRELTAAALPALTDFDPLRALAIQSDISRAVGAGLDLDATVDAILRTIEQSILFDSAEVTLWHADTQTLRPVGPAVQRTPTGTLVKPSEQTSPSYTLGEGYSGWIAMYHQPLLVGDVTARTDVMPTTFRGIFQSYVGVPLMIGDRFIGTLELVSNQRHAFDQRDVALLQAVAGQVAAAVEAARLYREQRGRVAELSGLQQIAEAMSQLGEPYALYNLLTQRVARLMDVELCGVLLYDDDEQAFRSQLPFYGVPDTLMHGYALSVASDTGLHTIWLHQPWWYANAPDAETIAAMGFEDLSSALILHGLALAPMIIGTRRVGLLVVGNKHGDREFNEDDMRLLMSFASQAAVVVENARMYAEEQRRTLELGGLQQIAQAMGALRSPGELFSQITARIADLMGAQMCGILLYDSESHLLASQRPFYGMDDDESVRFYQLPSPPGSAVARLWQERATWFSNDVRSDSMVSDTDLARMAAVVGIRQTVIATLVVGGTRLGIIQVSNRLDGSDFTDDDARLLSIFAGQAAVLIDNARLYREMQSRTHEAEGLRAVTEIASQRGALEPILEQILIAIANLLESDVVGIALVDENTGELVIDPAAVWGITLDESYRMDAYASGFEQSVLVSRRPFMSNSLRDDRRVLPQYRTLIDRLDLHNVIQVPLAIHDRSLGELTVANRTPGTFYNDSDVQLLMAIATQVAAMIDRQRLHQATDQGLRARLQELDALGRVSHELSQTIELGRILDVIRQEALRSTPTSAVTVVLLVRFEDDDGVEHVEIAQRFGEAKVFDDLAPIERAVIQRGSMILVADYAEDELGAVPDEVRSALVVPVLFGEQVTGLIHLYSDQPGVFDQRTVDFVMALTNQAAIAIGNARRYQEQLEANQQLRIRAERMGRIFDLGEMFRQGASLPDMLEEVAHSVQETVGFNVVLLSLADARAGVLRRTAQAGLPLTAFEEMQRATPSLEQARGLMQSRYRISHSYFLPAEGAADLIADLPIYQVLQERMGPSARAWAPEDLLIVPLWGARDRLLGIMTVDEPRSGRRPDLATVEALEIFASQAAFSIENYRLVERIQQEAELTRRERDRLAQLHLVASEIQRAVDVPSRLQVVADGIYQAGWGKVVITLRDEHLEPTAMIHAGFTPEEAESLADDVVSGKVWRQWLNDLSFHELKLGAGYYLRYNQPWVREHVFGGQDPDPADVPDDAWHPQDLIYMPLVGQDQRRIIGVIAMGDPVDGNVPSEASLQPFELFASQAAAAIETTRLYLETVRAAEQEQRLNEMMEVVSSSLSPEAVIEAIGRGLQQMVPFTRMSVALFDEQAGHLDLLRADLAPDGSVRVTHDAPLSLEGTAMGAAYQASTARLFALHREADAREQYGDAQAWFDSGERSALVVPMTAGGQVIGALHLGSELETAYGFEENLELIQRLANLSAVALDNARLFGASERRATELDEQAQRLRFLNRVSALLAQTLTSEEIYRIVLTELQGALNLQYGGVMLIQDEDTARLVLSTHPMDPPTPDLVLPLKGNKAAEYIIETHKPVVSEDLLHDRRFKAMWQISKARDTRAMIIAPLVVGDRLIGTLGLDSSTPRAFTEAEIDLVITTANQAAVAIETGRLFAEVEQRAIELQAQAQRLALVNRVSMRLAQTLDPQEIYAIVLSELGDLLNVQLGGLVLFEDEHTGRLALNYPLDQPTPRLTLSLKDNRSIERVRETRKPLVSEDVLNDPLFEQAWDVLRQRGTRSLMIVPLVVGDQVIGTIGLDSTEPRSFTGTEIELASTIANQASVAIEKARLYNETLALTLFNQAVIESIQQGIVVMDHDLRVRRLNTAMIERYSWPETAVGRWLFEVRPDYAEFLREPMAVAIALGEPQMSYDVERIAPSGERSVHNYYVYPMLEDQTVTGVVLLVEDVTERLALEADLASRAVQLAALSEVSSQITATLEPDQVIDLILDALDRVIPYDGVSLWLRSAQADELEIVAARGYRDADSPDANALIGLTVEIPYSPLFREMSEAVRVINAPDVSAGDPRFPYGSEAVYKNWLGAPLISKGRVVGVLALEKREPNYYDALHEQLTLTFANQAAVALDNAQLFQETRARAMTLDEQARRLALLNRVSLALAQSLDLENILEIALREAALALEIAEGSAIQIDHSEKMARVIVNYPRGDVPPDQAFDIADSTLIDRIQRGLIPLAIEHVATDPQVDELRAMMRYPDVASCLLVPLVVGGNVVGVLRLDSVGETRAFTDEQIELAQTIASQTAIAAQNASLFEETAGRTRELETLFESAQATAVTLDLNEVVRRVGTQMLNALRAEACTVFLWDDVANQLEVRGDISTRPDDVPPVRPGQVSNLDDYPLRRRAVLNRELVVARANMPDLPPNEARILEEHQAASRMMIPLVVNDISIGLIEVEILDPGREFKAEDVRLARTLASQSAISIENARLQTETRRTVEELYVINDMAAALSSAADLAALLQVVADQLPNLTDAQMIYVALYERDTNTITFPMVLYEDEPSDAPDCPFGQDEFSTVIRRQSPLLLAGDNIDEVRRSLGILTVMPGSRCFLGVPLFAGDEVIGVLALRDNRSTRAFGHDEQRVLTTVGSQLGVAIQSARLFQQTLRLAEELDQRVRERTTELDQERQHISTLYQITAELATSLDMERLLHRALEMVARSVGATQGAILATDAISGRLYYRAHFGELFEAEAGSPDAANGLDLEEGLAGWAVHERQNLIVDNVQDDPRWLRQSEADDLPRAALVTLIESNEDVLGVIMLYSEQEAAFHPDQLRLVTAAANQIATAMNNAELYSLVRDQAERLGTMLRQEQVEATQSASILESVADGVMVANADGMVIVYNTAAERILGVSSERVLNRPMGTVAGLYGPGAGRWTRTVEGWMRDPDSYQPGDYLEEHIDLEDGRVISVRLSPVHMGDRFLGTVSIIRDITREVEVDRLKSEFVATVSHELRTPMTSIKGYADLLLLGAAGEVSEQQQRFLETIKQNADRLSILVNDLLDISRIDQGRIELTFGVIDVPDLLEAVSGHLRGRSEDEKRPMTIHVNLPEDQRLTVWGDYDKVAQIITNLGDNAFNYTPPDGEITLAATLDEAIDRVIITVTDTGIGIPPELGDSIFERFFRGDELHELVMDTPGTGLGLSIVREFVKVHHGRVWYESQVGQGTSFYVELPTKQVELAAGGETPVQSQVE